MTKTLCSVPDCPNPIQGKGLCPKHYWRLRTYGNTDDRPKRERTVIACRVAGCANDAQHIGERLCAAHYARERRHGDPSGGNVDRGTPADGRLWRQVRLPAPSAEGPCWEWTGSKNKKGYGQLTRDYTSVKAHRLAYETIVGPIPEGMDIDHLCRNTSCVNPAHLEPVTPEENVRRGTSFSVTNAAKTHCIHGHELTEENSYGYKGRRQCKTCAQRRAREQRSK